MSDKSIGRGGDTLIQDLGGGKKVSFQDTPDGLRANLHEGAVTRPVDPAAFGVSAISSSIVGGGNRRVTVVTTDNQAIDHTQRSDRTLDEQIHTGGSSHKK